MKALLCEAYGPPETLALREVPLPLPGPGEIRLRVVVAGVNFPDTLIIQNKYQIRPPLPFSPGGEAAGFVDAIGDGVTGVAIGDRVAAMTFSGAFAEQVIVKADRLVPLPDAISFGIGAALTMAYGTSHHALKQRAALRPGETVLVLGAGGGVGLAAVEVAKAMGARVIAAASSAEKLAVARDHGADLLVDYSGGDLRAALKAVAGDTPIDVIYDPVGGALAEPAFRSIGRNGRYLVVGFAAGEVPSIALNLPLLKAASIVGVFWGAFTVDDRAEHLRNMAELYAWVADGTLRPLITRTYTLEEGADAIRWLMDRKATGKVIVSVAPA